MAVLVGRIEVQIAATIRHDRALGSVKGAVTIMLLHGLLPAAAPPRGAWRYKHLCDGTTAGARCKDCRSANETVRGVIEVIGVELIDRRHPGRARANKGIDLDVFLKECSSGCHHLIGIVLAHDSLTGRWVIGLSHA